MKRLLVTIALFAAACCGTLGQDVQPPATSAPAKAPHKVKILGTEGRHFKPDAKVTSGKLEHRVQPNYPALARQTKVAGTVTLDVIINKNGEVEEASLVSGHPLLVSAAIDAVKQWKYSPTLVDGEPFAVETTIEVTFSLNDAKSGASTQTPAPH